MPRKLPTTLRLEALDERVVPAVTLAKGQQYELANTSGGIVRHLDARRVGPVRSVVRIDGANGGAEQGYNTTARPVQFDEKKGPRATRALTVGQVPVVVVNGVKYREFVLDVNQKASASKLSVDEVRVFLGDRPDLRGYDAGAKTLAGRKAVFDLDRGGNETVTVDARLNRGRGAGDMALLVPDAAFAGATVGTYVYLYSRMGATAGATANGGFEEWGVRKCHPVVAPPAGGQSLSGFVYEDFDGNGVKDAGENGIADVSVLLEGTDVDGNPVSRTTTTLADGSYSFAGVAPGTYTITEVFQPFGFDDGDETVGSLGGFLGEDQFVQVVVAAGQTGTGYNFGERPIFV